MKAQIITIGDEIISGYVENTNASWLARLLTEAGISVEKLWAIGDKAEEITQTLDIVSKSTDLAIITGGLGPTNDDITKKTLADYFQQKLVFNQEMYNNIEALFAARGMSVTELNRLQAFVPENCIALPNKTGTAPGMWFQEKNFQLISLPGVPGEMKTMFSHHVLPKLINSINDFWVQRVVMTHGMGESHLADRIAQWESQIPKEIKLAYLPSYGIVRLRLSGKSKDRQKLSNAINEQVAKLEKVIPELIYGYDDISMEEVIGKLLSERKESLGTAESCTGGYIAQLITSVPGASRYFMGSVVAYSNTIKTSLLNVSEELLNSRGAVSIAVAEKMAEQCRRNLNCTYGIATTGIAGPGGGTNTKPVGTVCIAVSSPHKTISRKFNFGSDRHRVVRRTTNSALMMLRELIMQTP